MSLLPLPLTGGALVMDNSTAEHFTTCPRSGQYYFIDKRELSGRKAALHFGGAIHKALEYRYKSGSIDLTQSILEGMVEKVRVAYTEWSPENDDYRSFDYAVRALLHYQRIYPFEDFQIADLNGHPAVEIPFAVSLGEIPVNATITTRETTSGLVETKYHTLLPVVWKGKKDMIVRREGPLYPLDHKTTSMGGPSYWSEFDLSHQVHGYSWAAEDLFHEAVAGFIINGLVCRKPSKTGVPFEFERKTVMIHRENLEEWHRDTMHILATVIQMYLTGYFPKHTKWCNGKYGPCKYRDVCTSLPSNREMVLASSLFQNVTWDPLNE